MNEHGWCNVLPANENQSIICRLPNYSTGGFLLEAKANRDAPAKQVVYFICDTKSLDHSIQMKYYDPGQHSQN